MQSRRDNFTVVPILVGSLSPDREVKYGRIFAKYLADPSNLFIISSDFCHWGKRFRYQEYDQSKGQIHESIKALDFEVTFNINILTIDDQLFSCVAKSPKKLSTSNTQIFYCFRVLI